MRIGYVSSQIPGETDALLSGLANRLKSDGRNLAGIVKDTTFDSRFENGCDMKVRVLPAGPSVKITQDLGDGSGACRLDPGAIATSVARVEASALDQADLFILNKFGPEEAAGRGFCDVIGTALELGVPVLVGVGQGLIPEFETFAAGLATRVAAEEAALFEWCASSDIEA
ncbi:DUF2478 domain-containing protein [Shimia sp.]|uniref:DUF2478 domain-containing protein n=1 Tax=Shimia sp. TaxID=1954381 RepID=UPI0032991E05